MFGNMIPDGCPARAATRRLRLRVAAQNYVAHGWPVVVGSRLCRDRFSCGPGCRITSCHPVSCEASAPAPRPLRDAADVAAAWHRSPYSVLLPTGDVFDVVDVPAYIGALAADALLGPVAVTPVGRWMFFVKPGSTLRPELAALNDVVLHGVGSWVPAPPVRSPEGSVRWLMSPRESQWRLPSSEQVQDVLAATQPRIPMTSDWLRRAA